MASKTPHKSLPRVAPITPEEAKRLVDIVDNAIYEFGGDVDHLESAIGMLFLGRYVGWRPLLLIHNKNTIRRNERILGIDIRKFFPEETPRSEKLNAYRAVKAIGNFWKAVSGDIKLGDRKKVQE
jgi:hypothetical protein